MTQAILGGAIAELGFREKLGTKAVVFGAICGITPDLDILINFFSSWGYIIYHRSFTHSLFILSILTPIFAWLGYCWGQRQNNYKQWFLLTFLALFTHPLLDIFTSYGTQIFWPFSNSRLYLDAISAIDLFYTVPLLLSIIIGSISYFSFRFRKYFAGFMFLCTIAYLVLGYANCQEACQLVQAEQSISTSQKIIRATPTLFNVWLWHVIVQDEDGNTKVAMVSTLVESPKIEFIPIPNDNSHPLTNEILQNEYGKIFYWFADGLVTFQVVQEETGTKVYLYDQRYSLVSDPTQNIFSACAEFDNRKILKSFEIVRLNDEPNIFYELKMMWKLLKN